MHVCTYVVHIPKAMKSGFKIKRCFQIKLSGRYSGLFPMTLFLFFFEISLIFILTLPKMPLSIFRPHPKSNVDHEGQH